MCRVLQCDEGTVKHGIREIENQLPPNDGTIRKKGAGRKRVLDTEKGLDVAFLQIMSPHTAVIVQCQMDTGHKKQVTVESSQSPAKIPMFLVNRLSEKEKHIANHIN